MPAWLQENTSEGDVRSKYIGGTVINSRGPTGIEGFGSHQQGADKCLHIELNPVVLISQNLRSSFSRIGSLPIFFESFHDGFLGWIERRVLCHFQAFLFVTDNYDFRLQIKTRQRVFYFVNSE